MRVAIVNYACASPRLSPPELVAAYGTLTGWARALVGPTTEVGVFQGAATDASWSADGVQHTALSGPFAPDLARWRFPRRLHEAVVRWRPDVVHLNGLTYPLQTLYLRSRLPRKTAVVVQHHGAEPMQRWRRHVQRRALAAVDGALFCGPDAVQHWRNAGALPEGTPGWSMPECASLLGKPDLDDTAAFHHLRGEPTVVWLGHLDRNKDPVTILKGISRIHDELPKLSLLMAFRTAPLLDEVQHLVNADTRLEHKVHLLGELTPKQVGSLLSTADLFVQGSFREGSGYAVIDAISRGVTPVVTDIPSFRYLTGGGRIGGLWKAGDTAEFSNRLLKVWSEINPATRAVVQSWSELKLSWPAVARRARAAYRLASWRRSGPGASR